MDQIITINESNKRFPVDAKELYEKLGFNGAHWARWSKQNIEDNQFAIKGEDFEGFTTMVNGNPTNDFNLSIDFAKRLCMMARTEMGERIRNYFLEVEKHYKTSVGFQLPQTFADALRLAADLEEERQRLLPKAEYFDALVERNLLTNFRDAAKELGIEERAFVKRLEEKHFIYRDAKSRIKPYAQYVPELFQIKEYRNPKTEHVGNQTLITPKGRETFRLLLNQI